MEPATPYRAAFPGENDPLTLKNDVSWKTMYGSSDSWLGPTRVAVSDKKVPHNRLGPERGPSPPT
jgi:hypothetical protein